MEYKPEVIKKLEDWAKNQPESNEPLLIMGKVSYTAKEILEQIKAKTKLGMSLYQSFVENTN